MAPRRSARLVKRRDADQLQLAQAEIVDDLLGHEQAAKEAVRS